MGRCRRSLRKLSLAILPLLIMLYVTLTVKNHRGSRPAAAAERHRGNGYELVKAMDLFDYDVRDWNRTKECTMMPIDPSVGRWDNSRTYKYWDFWIVGEQYSRLSSDRLACLATQASLEHLYELPMLAESWHGPISIAVFAGNEEVQLLSLYVSYLRRCFPAVRNFVSFSLAVPDGHPPEQHSSPIDAILHAEGCDNPQVVMARILKLLSPSTASWRKRRMYPQNHLRNLARKACQTKFVLLVDIDILPCEDLTGSLEMFLSKVTCKKCVYVVPTFELDHRLRIPKSKKELIRLYKKKLAQPFHEKIFIYNQYATNISRWQQTIESESQETYVHHNVTNFELFYEPFYVSEDSVPPHDERFVGYGFTRNTQVYETFLAGYSFQVLSPIFMIHRGGIQTMKNRGPVTRWRQNDANRKKFHTFKKEVFARYGVDPLNLMKMMKQNPPKKKKS